jgi:DNA-binding transcriptional LysR family regulator
MCAVRWKWKDLVGSERTRGRGRGGSFAKAVELIGITDSGVSRAIGRLETRLGVRLLDRTTRSMALTDEGRCFYEEVKPNLDAIEEAAVPASAASSAVRGRFKVDIDPFFLPLVLAGRLGALCERALSR